MSYIEREAYVKYLASREAKFIDDYGKGWSTGISAARKTAEKFPAADVAPVAHGLWTKYYCSGTKVKEGYVSSCCDMWNDRCSNYCPNCGARMDGETDA